MAILVKTMADLHDALYKTGPFTVAFMQIVPPNLYVLVRNGTTNALEAWSVAP